jgi:diaminohydroxyphosphoribosylaminopyrimidine deaminase / 5-amino-6-(5-phosphoribosylamino)uracil reductase
MTEADSARKPIRPSVTLKLATSLDGKIATGSGASKWITGPEARAAVHQMRADHDCVLTGIGTVLADDPELTARLDLPSQRQPIRAVLDSKARTPQSAKLLTTLNQGPVCFFHDHDYAGPENGATHYRVAQGAGGLDLGQVLATLALSHAVASLMVEAGSQVAGSFLKAGLVDKIVWFRAPIIIGGDGLSVFGSLGADALGDALAFESIDISACGVDRMETYVRRGT